MGKHLADVMIRGRFARSIEEGWLATWPPARRECLGDASR